MNYLKILEIPTQNINKWQKYTNKWCCKRKCSLNMTINDNAIDGFQFDIKKNMLRQTCNKLSQNHRKSHLEYHKW